MNKYLFEYLYDYIRSFSFTTQNHLINYLNAQSGIPTSDVTIFLSVVLQEFAVFSLNVPITDFTSFKNFITNNNITNAKLISMLELIRKNVLTTPSVAKVAIRKQIVDLNVSLLNYTNALNLMNTFISSEINNIQNASVKALITTEANKIIVTFTNAISSLNLTIAQKQEELK